MKKILRLLIVEDEKQMCDTVARSLYAAGYEVDTCYDGAEALECILAENYDPVSYTHLLTERSRRISCQHGKCGNFHSASR